MADLLLNARFLMRPMTGVDRVATELACALLADPARVLRARHPGGKIAQAADRPAALLDVATPLPSALPGPVWEQLVLPRARPGDWLLSLCNMGPVRRARQIVMIHDAQVFSQPQSYRRAFRRWYRLAQPRVGHRAARVLTVSEHSRRELIRFGIAPPDRISVVPNGADHVLRLAPDHAVLARHGLTSGGYLLAIGSLAPHKNLPMLAAAARARRDARLPLVIAGGGNARVFGDAGIAACDDIRILGRVSDSELRALYDHARALLFPSQTEGFGLPAAEAMTCGCPVIASTGGAIPEICDGAAILLNPADREGWTDAMMRIARDDALHSRLTEEGSLRARRYTWAAAATAVSEIIDALEAQG